MLVSETNLMANNYTMVFLYVFQQMKAHLDLVADALLRWVRGR